MKVNKRGIVAAGAIAIVSTLTLAGCSTGTSSDDTSGSDDSGSWSDLLVSRLQVVDDLQRELDQDKTGVKVELTGKSVDDMKDDFIQQVPTGKGPDIVMGAHDWLGELSTNGVVAPIELGDSSEDYLPVALQAATYDGTVYMLRTPSRTSRCCATPTWFRPPRPASTTCSRRGPSSSSRVPRATRTTSTRSRRRSAPRCSAPTTRAATTPPTSSSAARAASRSRTGWAHRALRVF